MIQLKGHIYDDMFELAKPLIKWLNDHGHPHHKIIIDNESVELFEGEARFNTQEFWKD